VTNARDDRDGARPRSPGEDFAAILSQYHRWIAAGLIDERAGAEGSLEAGAVSEWSDLEADRAFLERMELVWPRLDCDRSTASDSDALETGNADAGSAAEVSDSPCDAEAAIEFGRFRILRSLGQGGAGLVFLAHDPVLQRDVALKVPRPEVLVAPVPRLRFLREGQAAAGLNHPNILPVHEAGQVGPVGYIASAYCAGPSLAEWLSEQDRPVPIKLAVQWVARLADALHYAHSRGVLHRDVKPSNVLLEPAPPGSPAALPFEPRLTDFGLAKQVEIDDGRTRTGVILGTPRYMAPEQADGRDDVSPATDVYALGAVLYELLTGETPFRGDTNLEILQRIAHAEPASPQRLRGDVPRDLAAVVLRALEKEPRNRYATAADLAADLRRFLAGESTEARPLSAGVRSARWCRKHPATAVLAALLVVLASGSFAAVTWQWRRAEAHLALADRERLRALENLRQGNRLLSEVYRQDESSVTATNSRHAVRSHTRRWLQDRYKRILNEGNAAAHGAAEVATANAKLAILLRGDEPDERIARRLHRSLELWQQLARQQPSAAAPVQGLADAHIDAMHVYIGWRDFDSARFHRRQAIQALEHPLLSGSAYTMDRHWLCAACYALGKALQTEGRLKESLRVYRETQAYWERELGEPGTDGRSDSLYLNVRTSIGRCLAEMKRWNEAIEASKFVASCYEKKLARAEPRHHDLVQLAQTYGAIARSQQALRQSEQALETYQKAAELCAQARALDSDDEMAAYDEADLLAQMADCLVNNGRYQQGKEAYQKSIEIFESYCLAMPGRVVYRRSLATTLFWYARFRADTMQPDAIDLLARVSDLCEEIIRRNEAIYDDRSLQARARMHRGRLLAARKRNDEARSDFAKAAELYEPLVAERPHEAGFVKDLAECRRRLAEPAVAQGG